MAKVKLEETKYMLTNENYHRNLNNYNTSPMIVSVPKSHFFTTPVVTPRGAHFEHLNQVHLNQPVIAQPVCPCAHEVRCQPCSGLFLNAEIIDCPCAPKPVCPSCPPLSLIHQIAAKKVNTLCKIRQNKILVLLIMYRISAISSIII